MEAGALERRIDELESRAAISALLANYCHGIDQHDLGVFGSIWHADAELLVGDPVGDFRGREAILDGVENVIWAQFLPETCHWTTNSVIEFSDPDHATGIANVNTAATTADGGRATLAATYRDEFERRDGEWRIARRICETHHQLPVAVPDE